MRHFIRYQSGSGPHFDMATGLDACCCSVSQGDGEDESGWYCTRLEGHDGPHAAGGSAAGVVYATWNDDESEE